MGLCAENDALVGEIQASLSRIIKINTATIDAVRDRDLFRLQELDQSLELAVGEKERLMGAWRQHRKEHGC
jgi:hypothetical protein